MEILVAILLDGILETEQLTYMREVCFDNRRRNSRTNGQNIKDHGLTDANLCNGRKYSYKEEQAIYMLRRRV